MSWTLNNGTSPPVDVKMLTAESVEIGGHEISLRDFLFTAEYVLTNVDLAGPGDLRLKFLERARTATVGPGWNRNGMRIHLGEGTKRSWGLRKWLLNTLAWPLGAILFLRASRETPIRQTLRLAFHLDIVLGLATATGSILSVLGISPAYLSIHLVLYIVGWAGYLLALGKVNS